jgi:hypothetical protein
MAIRAAIFRRASPLRRARRSGAIAAACCTLALVPSARAENTSGVPDPVAQALFQDGRDLVDKGQWDAGCTKFDASMLLYPAASTLLNIARCHEHKQKLASAWSAYKRVQVLNRETMGEERRRAIDEMVTAQIAALTPRVPKIKLSLKHDAPGLSIRKDGESLPAAVIGTEVPVDVGEHEILAEAPGRIPFRERFEIKEGRLHEIAIDLAIEGEPGSSEGGARVPAWAWVSGGGGLVLLGLAAGFRVDQAFVEGHQNGACGGDLKHGCPPKNEYDPAPDNARKKLDFGLSVGFGVAGAVALAASIYGIVRGTTKPSPGPVAAVIVTKDGAAVSATFKF